MQEPKYILRDTEAVRMPKEGKEPIIVLRKIAWITALLIAIAINASAQSSTMSK